MTLTSDASGDESPRWRPEPPGTGVTPRGTMPAADWPGNTSNPLGEGRKLAFPVTGRSPTGRWRPPFASKSATMQQQHWFPRARFVTAPALKSFIGLICRKQFSTNSVSWYIVACMAKRCSIWQTPVYQCPTSQHGSIFDPLLGVSWWFCDAGSAHSVHGPSLWLARRFGTLYRQLERSGSWQGQLQMPAEDAFIYSVLKHLAYQRWFRTIRSTN